MNEYEGIKKECFPLPYEEAQHRFFVVVFSCTLILTQKNKNMK
ncbi:hypothetical protein P783_0198 [Enterococcus faecalis GA2]|nr:hypothetical protein P783_0198 [Enterococcus faecalis GA2]